MSGFFDEHLTFDAVGAFVDGELSAIAYQRAAAHLVRCGLCSSEVGEQAAAREMLRSTADRVPTMPGSLAATLRSIPIAMPLRETPTLQQEESPSRSLLRMRRTKNSDQRPLG